MIKQLFVISVFLMATVSAANAAEERRAPTENPGYETQRWAGQPANAAPSPAPVKATEAKTEAKPEQKVEAKAAPKEPEAVSTEGRTPLVVVRFLKPTVTYQESLYNAVSEAVKVNPNVMFDVVGFPPAGGKNSSLSSKAPEVVSALHKMGVPQSRITLQTKPSKAGYEEVMVFVR